MLTRILEPEVMDTAAEALDYNQMDHGDVNRLFVDDFLVALKFGNPPTGRQRHLFDAGTGTALIPIELLRRDVNVFVTASDLAEQMLVVARQNVNEAKLDRMINLVSRDCKCLPEADGTYDAVMSNSIIHHIPDPRQVLRELWRVVRPGGILFVRDLMRPQSSEQLERLVGTYAGHANPHQQRMFRESLYAALTVEEVQAWVNGLGLAPEFVKSTSDRHWTLQAIHP